MTNSADVDFELEPDGDEATGVCDCCGNVSRLLTGFIHRGDATVAGYSVGWTVGHYPEKPANLDLVIGRWGEGAGSDQRFVVSLLMYVRGDGPPEVYVIDAIDRPIAQRGLADAALARNEVVGTPIAKQVFDLVDVITERDHRLQALLPRADKAGHQLG